jgi:hypothetical protein
MPERPIKTCINYLYYRYPQNPSEIVSINMQLAKFFNLLSKTCKSVQNVIRSSPVLRASATTPIFRLRVPAHTDSHQRAPWAQNGGFVRGNRRSRLECPINRISESPLPLRGRPSVVIRLGAWIATIAALAAAFHPCLHHCGRACPPARRAPSTWQAIPPHALLRHPVGRRARHQRSDPPAPADPEH